MKTLKSGLLFLAVLSLAACVTINEDDDDNGGGGGGGGGTGASGVSTTTKATDFTTQEKESFCEWFVDLAAPKVGQTFQCADEIEITIEPYSVSQCESELANNENCPVSELEDCFTVLIDDPCLVVAETAPAACAQLAQCTAGDGGGGDNNDNNVSNTNSTFCYDHDCNGDATGEQCFSTQEDYCDSLCQETNCISTVACENECL